MDVGTDPQGWAELQALGARNLPVVSRGAEWVNGQSISELARFVGIAWQHQPLAPPLLYASAMRVLEVAGALAAQMPASMLFQSLTRRPRTYAFLVGHIRHIEDAFLMLVEEGRAHVEEDLLKPLPDTVGRPVELVAYVADCRLRLADWWQRSGAHTDFEAEARVYYGQQTLHEYFERTVWHAAQHTRQLTQALEELGIVPAARLSAADCEGLPLPGAVWD